MAIILIIRVLITEVTRMTARKVWHGTLKVLHNFLSLRGVLTPNREPEPVRILVLRHAILRTNLGYIYIYR